MLVFTFLFFACEIFGLESVVVLCAGLRGGVQERDVRRGAILGGDPLLGGGRLGLLPFFSCFLSCAIEGGGLPGGEKEGFLGKETRWWWP